MIYTEHIIHPTLKSWEVVSTKNVSAEANRHSIPTTVFSPSNENREKLWNFIAFYRLTRQPQDDFETFVKNFELNDDIIFTSNFFLAVVLGDFNATSNLYCKSDIA